MHTLAVDYNIEVCMNFKWIFQKWYKEMIDSLFFLYIVVICLKTEEHRVETVLNGRK